MDRQKIIAGNHNVGDMYGGRKITGLGKTWSGVIPDDEACCWGLPPGDDHYVQFQYAYFN